MAICPHDTLSLVDGKAKVTGDDSLSCGHCLGDCPEEAITLSGYQKMTQGFQTLSLQDEPIAPGDFNPGSLVQLMASRRSCRHFTKEPVPMALLEDLVQVGITAPSGTNAQLWSFTLLPDRSSVECFAQSILDFFKKLNRMAKRAPLRTLLKWLGKPELSHYHENYFDRIEEGIDCWENQRWDRLFHGAPCAMLVSCKNEASCGAEDALLATGQILLAAHAMDLGTCLVGFAVSAMEREKAIREAVQIPSDETVHAVIAMGWPKERYHRPTVRKPVTPRVVRMKET